MRSSLQPKGIFPGLEAKARRFLERENAIAERALFLVHLVKRAGGKVLFEHPAKVADATSRYYHVSTKNISSIFDWEEVAELQTRWHCMWVELSLCALLHIFRKATRLLYSQELHNTTKSYMAIPKRDLCCNTPHRLFVLPYTCRDQYHIGMLNRPAKSYTH